MFPAIKHQVKILLSIENLLLLVALTATSLAQSPATTPVTASSPAAPLTFEVSTVKLNTSGSGNSRSGLDRDRFSATNVTLKNLMVYSAYGIPESRILGGPKWLATQRFDIEAKMNAPVADQLRQLSRAQRRTQLQVMFQQLLADRFQLKAHWETRQLPVYALVVAKNGSRLQPSATTTGTNTNAGNGVYTASDISIPALADSLTQELASELGRTVIDKTALPGQYDIALKWTPEKNTDLTGVPSLSDSSPSIFTAIQEQLGLKLEPTKGPVQVLVIDHIEQPSEN